MRHKLIPEMEGSLARWYAKQRGSAPQLAAYRTSAANLTTGLPEGADILEIAPGPGYHAVELARLGFQVTGLDIARTAVRIAHEYAENEGVAVDFRHGDASSMPFDAESYDLIVCQAAFKNFVRPLDALNEMCRVLRSGGVAVIQDLRKEATSADIEAEVGRMRIGRLSGAFVRLTLTGLRRRAYSCDAFERLAARSAFGGCEITTDGIGLEARLVKA